MVLLENNKKILTWTMSLDDKELIKEASTMAFKHFEKIEDMIFEIIDLAETEARSFKKKDRFLPSPIRDVLEGLIYLLLTKSY